MAINERKSSCEQIFHYHYIYTMKFLSPALYLHNIYPYYYWCWCCSKNLILLNSLTIAYWFEFENCDIRIEFLLNKYGEIIHKCVIYFNGWLTVRVDNTKWFRDISWLYNTNYIWTHKILRSVLHIDIKSVCQRIVQTINRPLW